MLKTMARKSDGGYLAREEFENWNNGTFANVYYDGESKEYFASNITADINRPKEKRYPEYVGVAFDSFGYGDQFTYIDEENRYTPGSDFIPYYLVDENDKAYLPLYSGIFQAMKYWESLSPIGIMINGFNMMPEMTYQLANVGAEIRMGETGYAKYNSYLKECFWTGRYLHGSRSLSYLENTDREKSFQCKEEYFSIVTSLGASPSYFSHNAASNNFWKNKNDVDLLRPFMKRWGPAINEAFNGSIYYANGLGLINLNIPSDKQVPDLNEKYDISTTSLWCKPKSSANSDGYVNCHLSIFLGYNAEHSNGTDFNRHARIEIEGINPQCLFKAENMTCNINNGNVDISMHGVESKRTFRTAIIKFGRKLSTNYPDYYNAEDNSNELSTGAIVAIVIVSIVIVAVIVFVLIYIFVIKGINDEKDSPLGV
jgi:hypothetical protein